MTDNLTELFKESVRPFWGFGQDFAFYASAARYYAHYFFILMGIALFILGTWSYLKARKRQKEYLRNKKGKRRNIYEPSK